MNDTEKRLLELCSSIENWAKIYLKNPKAFGKEKADLFKHYETIYACVNDYIVKNAKSAGKSSKKVEVRLPFLEVFATQAQVVSAAFSESIRPLTKKERKIALEVFQFSLRLDEIRIEEEAVIANAPTTLGNVIRLSKGYKMTDGTLVHELTHVWQYQNKGTKYISNSVIAQVGGMLSSGDRNAAYAVKVEKNKSFSSYSAEHQAMIVENWYTDKSKRKDPEYMRLIAEVRMALPPPVLDPTQIYMESMYGPETLNDRLMDNMQPDQFKDLPKIPANILKVNF